MNKNPVNKHLLGSERRAVLAFLKAIQRKKILLSRLILFGSKARGNFTPDSDIDLLAITQNSQARKQLYKEIASILSHFGVYLSVKAFTPQEFKKLSRLKTPFMENIKKEGIILWPRP